MQVIVVGAGLAGLRCARLLLDAGVDVQVIEGGDRVGGRARTVMSAFVGGQFAESGAEWVDTDHHRMIELLRQAGLSLEGEGQEWTMLRRLLFRDGRLLSPEDVHTLAPTLDAELEHYSDLFEAIAAGITDPSRPDLHPDAATHDARSMADVANAAGLGELAGLFAARNAQGEFAAELREVSALFVAQQRAQMNHVGAALDRPVRAHRVAGGLSQLASWMADAVGRERIHLGELVSQVSWDDDRVEVRTATGMWTGDHVVLACALGPLRSVTFEPPLPPRLRAAIDGVGYGTVTKTALQFTDRTAWPAGYTNTTLPSQRVYEPTIDQPGPMGIAMAYTGGDGGRRLAELDENRRIDSVAADLATMYPTIGAPLGGFSRAWSAEPRFGGSYAAYGPGTVTAHWQVLREPHGRLHLAGEHVATWTGYLEGAVESAETVADRIVRA